MVIPVSVESLYLKFQVLTAACVKLLSSGMLRIVVSCKLTDVSEVLTASIIRARIYFNSAL